MNLLKILKPKGKQTYYQSMRPVMYIALFIGLFISFPSVQSNYGFIKNSMLKDYDNVFYLGAFFCAAAFLDFTKSYFFSKTVELYYNSEKKMLDGICVLGSLIFFFMSLFFSYNCLENKNQQEEVDRIEHELKDSTFSTSNIIILNKDSKRSERKKSEANIKTLKAAAPIIEDRQKKIKAVAKIKAALVSKDFYWLLMLDVILYFCLFASSSIKSKEYEEETDLESSETQELNKEVALILLDKIKGRYRAAMSRNDPTKAEKYRVQIESLGGKVPSSKLNAKDE